MDCNLYRFCLYSRIIILEELEDIGEDELKSHINRRFHGHLEQHFQAAASALGVVAGRNENSDPVNCHYDGISLVLGGDHFIHQGLIHGIKIVFR